MAPVLDIAQFLKPELRKNTSHTGKLLFDKELFSKKSRS